VKPIAIALILLAGVHTAASTDAQAPAGLHWTMMPTGVTASLRGISAVSDRVVWASGSGGTVIRTTDGGKSWKTLPVPGSEALDFRDIDAVDERTAYVLSIGSGDASRIFKTMDGGLTWTPQFRNQDPKAFFDAMVFSNAFWGFALSDAVDGQFVLIRTIDGERWSRVPPDTLPPAVAGEGAYAASGTNLAIQGSHVWFATSASRVIRSTDGGRKWTAVATPLPTGTSAGIFSIAFRDRSHGIVVGGDYKNESDATDNAAVSEDGGASWTLVKGLGGFRSAVAFIPALERGAVAVGPSGTDYSIDDGRTWRAIEGQGFHTVSVGRRSRNVWAAGEKGAVGTLRF